MLLFERENILNFSENWADFMCQNTNELFTDVIKSEKKMFTLLKYIFSKTPN